MSPKDARPSVAPLPPEIETFADVAAYDAWQKQQINRIGTLLGCEQTEAAIHFAATCLSVRHYLSHSPSWAEEARVAIATMAARHPETLEAFLAAARQGNRGAHQVLCVTAEHFILGGKPLPEPLRPYACNILRGHGPKFNPGRNRDPLRDIAIVLTVNMLRRFYTPTRNASTATVPSGCSIVSQALGRLHCDMSEEGVQKIWRRRARIIEPAVLHF